MYLPIVTIVISEVKCCEVSEICIYKKTHKKTNNQMKGIVLIKKETFGIIFSYLKRFNLVTIGTSYKV